MAKHPYLLDAVRRPSSTRCQFCGVWLSDAGYPYYRKSKRKAICHYCYTDKVEGDIWEMNRYEKVDISHLTRSETP